VNSDLYPREPRFIIITQRIKSIFTCLLTRSGPALALLITVATTVDNHRMRKMDETYSPIFELIGVLLSNALTKPNANQTAGPRVRGSHPCGDKLFHRRGRATATLETSANSR
jgi:hypothetical protein